MKLGTVKSGKGKRIEVHWDKFSKEVYVDYAGRSLVGHAETVSVAMDKAKAWLHDK